MMRRVYRQRGIGLVAAGALAVGVMLTACGGSEKPAGTSTTQDQQPAVATSAVSGGAGSAAATAQPQARATTAPQPAVGGLPSAKSCLVGDWEVQDLQGYMGSLLNQGGNRIASVTGSMRMSAKPDGTITENMSKVTVNMTTSGSTMAVTMDGNVTAKYAEDGGRLTFSNIGGNLTTSATIDGKQLVPPTNAADNSFLGRENSQIDYQCKGDTLSFLIPGRESTALTFHRR
jgi:hypothetical protein